MLKFFSQTIYKLISFALLPVVPILSVNQFAHAAAKQFKCDGRIQYRPCSPSQISASNKVTIKLLDTQRNAVRASLRRDKLQNEKYATVIKTTLRKMPRAEGQWRGLVRGQGDVHLTLQILRNGEVQETKYMGHVVLANKETNFSFISKLPKGNDWDWRVLALAR